MRVFFVLLFISLFVSCKTKEVLPQDQMIKYVVILKEASNPSVLKKGIPNDILDYRNLDKKLNQWVVDFKALPTENEKLGASLLNHPKVISVFTWAQFEKLKQKNENKAVDGAFGKGGAAKQ